MRCLCKALFPLTLLILLNPFAQAESVQVAVASNFSKPMQQIAAAFATATGHEAKLSFGSSGKFVAQISHGAPFDVLLSADTEKPQKLAEMGLADADTVFTYARGRLALWSADANYPINPIAGAKTLGNADFNYIALADPKLAPYGRAAEQVLAHLELSAALRERIVTGENISQAYQFVSTGNAELGFVALSQICNDVNGYEITSLPGMEISGFHSKLRGGSAWLIPMDYYSPIRQDAILLDHGRDNVAARALLDFLRSDVALDIMRGFGYGSPIALSQ